MTNQIQVTIEELRLRNFRAFENARLRLSNLTFLVGRNGAGKTSLLDAIELLREAMTDNLENALDRRGGLLKVRRASAGNDENPSMGVAVLLDFQFSGGRQTRAIYGFELIGTPANSSYKVRECLKLQAKNTSFFERDGGDFDASRKTGVTPPRSNLVLPLIGRSDSVWEAVYDTARRMRVYDLSPSAIEASSKIGQSTNLNKAGSNAGDVLKAIEGTNDHQWVERHLTALTPGFRSVRTDVLMGRRMLVFTQDQQGESREYDASQVSQGTLRGLGILLALRQQPTPTLIFVDEVENSVHPSTLCVLLDAAEASKNRSRIVLTTHSPEVLDHPTASGERLRVVEWRDGKSTIHRLNDETVAAVDEIETVGAMLRSNSLWPEDEPEKWGGDFFELDEPDA